jgi:signal transduction histidine kinase
VGDVVRYTALRAGQPVEVQTRLQGYPLLTSVRHMWPVLLFEALLFALAAFIALRRPRDPAARVLLVLTAVMPFGFTAWPLPIGVIDLAGGRGVWAQVIGSVAWTLVWTLLAHFALLFPEPPPARLRRRLTILLYLLPVAAYAGYLAVALPSARGPLARLERLVSVSIPMQLIAGVVILALISWSYRRTTDPQRRRRARPVLATLVVALGASVLFDQVPSAMVGRSMLRWPIEPLLFLACALAIANAILRHRLFDIDVIIRRSLVYGGATAALMAIYVTEVVLLDLLVSRRPHVVELVAGMLAAVAFQPAHARLSRHLSKRVFGHRDDPFTVVSRLARLGPVIQPRQMLTALVETLAQALRLPYAEIELSGLDGRVEDRFMHGSPAGAPVTVPLAGMAQCRGRLLLDPGLSREPFGPADAQLLQAISVHLGAAVHTALLAGQLQQSRERLVAAREEERRRLQRDLHDGVGPTLASTAMQAEAALELMADDPDAAGRAVGVVATQTKLALAEIRRIVHSLRPPALDQVGLVEAIRERACSFELAAGMGRPRGFAVQVTADDGLDPLPAGVEVAAFAIVLEAVANAARHGDATRCDVQLRRRDVLRVEVVDDGLGIAADAVAGVGLASMRERAAELGGGCVVERGGDGGTWVRAWFPLPVERSQRP